jgi:hypothetical protein
MAFGCVVRALNISMFMIPHHNINGVSAMPLWDGANKEMSMA